MLDPLPFNALVAFEAAARHLSFSKAAAELNVPPAAGVDDCARGVDFNHPSLALEAAVHGQGVVLSIAKLAARDLADGRLLIPFEAQVPLE